MTARRRPRRPLPGRAARFTLTGRLPVAPLAALAASLALAGIAWTTTRAPGESRVEQPPARFTLEIPAEHRGVITSWESFFICYGLTDERVIDLTLRANQVAGRDLAEPPGERVQVELPPLPGADHPVRPRDDNGGAGDALNAAKQRIQQAITAGSVNCAGARAPSA